MAEPTKTTPKADAENTATTGDRDRVAMLSLRADGTPDQIRPELLDQESAQAASRQQFVEQAVSAADVERNAARRVDQSIDENGSQDPSIADAQKQDEATAKAAEAAADKAVKALSA